jgi:hypothetical protein
LVQANVSDLFVWTTRRRADRQQRLAVQYVEHGWPIARLAIQREGYCACRLVDCVEPHLAPGQPPVITSVNAAETAFSNGRWAIALLTWRFDVLDLPPHFGAPLHHHLKAQCPTALAPATRHWYFFVAPGSVPPSLIDAAGGRLSTGSSDWVIAPGTYTESTGRIRWLTPPYLAHWLPYQRRDAIDIVLSTVDWSDADAPAAGPTALVDEALT